MPNHTWLWLTAAACCAPAACTFGADNFKVVEETAGGDATTAGGKSGGGGSGGNSALGGNDTTPGDAGAPTTGMAGDSSTPGGAGGQPSTVTLTCANRGQKVTLFSAGDVAGGSFGAAALVGGGASYAYAVVTADAPGGGALLAVRRVTDSMSNPVAELKLFAPQGHFQYGGAYADQMALHVVGADQRGIIDVAFRIDANGQFDMMAMPVVAPLQTPNECLAPTGNVRDIKATFDGELNYVVTCETGNDMGFSLHRRRPDGVLEPLAGTMNPISSIVRQFVHSHDGSSLLQTGDEFGTVIELRYGKSPMELGVPHQLRANANDDPSIFQSALLLPLNDYSGTFLVSSTLHDPSMGAVAPVTLYGGTFKVADYPELAKVAPKPLKQMAYYTQAADVVLPSDGAVRANDALLVGNDPIANSTIFAWMVDLDGNPRSQRLTVDEKDGTIDTALAVQVGAGFLVAWRVTDATTSIAARPIGCF